MDKDIFVAELKKMTPLRKNFVSLGYSDDLIERSVKGYECTRLDRTFNLNINDEILRLLFSYDCSTVQVGVVTFAKEIREIEDFYLIGEVEADVLALNKITLEIQVLDYLNLDWVIWNCAVNGDCFLSALLLCAELFSKRINDDDVANNTSLTYEYVLMCTEKAGGDKYLDFYKLLLGYDG